MVDRKYLHCWKELLKSHHKSPSTSSEVSTQYMTCPLLNYIVISPSPPVPVHIPRVLSEVPTCQAYAHQAAWPAATCLVVPLEA